MPLTMQKAGATLAALEAGDIKLRVRVLESERADRRQGVLQVSSGPGFRRGPGSSLALISLDLQWKCLIALSTWMHRDRSLRDSSGKCQMAWLCCIAGRDSVICPCAPHVDLSGSMFVF